MGTLLTYSITGGLLMLAMYLAYRLFLAADNQHGFNRGVLLMIYFAAFAAPAFIPFIDSIGAVSATPVVMENIDIAAEKVTTRSGSVWIAALLWIYMAGMVVVFAKTAYTWFRLCAVIRNGMKIKCKGYTLVVTDNDKYAPFSWMRHIVVSRSDYENNCPAIIEHELKHIEARHWIDLLIAQAVCIVNWFNPVAWLMRDELMLVHEYQADMAVIDNGHDPQEYQRLLIKKAVGSRFPSLANSLNHSKLKKRITMMYREKSGAGRRFKALALVPMLALALSVTNMPSVRAVASTLSHSDVSVGKVSENQSDDKTGSQSFKVKDLNNNGNQTTIVLKGENLGNNLTVTGGTFTTAGKTYQSKSMNCQMTDGVATITVVFPFTDTYENSSMTLTINGKEMKLDLEDFFNNANTLKISGLDDSDSKKVSAYMGKMKIYLDGEEITQAQMMELSPERIEGITVNKQENTILITIKK